MADQCYFGGDFYQAREATSAGESPTTAPSKWSKIKIPAPFRPLLAQLAYGRLLQLDGQNDKAIVELRSGQADLDDAVRVEANMESWRQRTEVQRHD